MRYKITREGKEVTLKDSDYISALVNNKAFVGGDGMVYTFNHSVTNSTVSGGYNVIAHFHEQLKYDVSHYLGLNKYSQEIWSDSPVTYRGQRYHINNHGYFFRLYPYVNLGKPIDITLDVLSEIELVEIAPKRIEEPLPIDDNFLIRPKA